MKFLVLGPLEVQTADGRGIPIGAALERALLLRLLLAANRPVTTGQLIEDLWGDTPPPTALATLRNYISRLRKALEEPDRIQWRSAGYALALEPDECDLTRFESLVRQAHELLGDHLSAEATDPSPDPTPALRLLSEALALWRGVALFDVSDLAWSRPAAMRLEERRLTALEDRIGLELAAGRHTVLNAELAELCRREPLRERLWAAWVLALYRCGRVGDALAAFTEYRANLVEQLGLEPSPELRDLQRRVLADDPTLQLPQKVAGPLGATGPRVITAPPVTPPDPAGTNPAEVESADRAGNLQAAATPFLGRAREVAEVTGLLWRTSMRLVTLTGAGGSGKTRLAHRVAELSSQDYPDGAWFAAFADITDPELIASTICQTIGVTEQPHVAPIDRLIEWCGQRRMLLVLDNLEQLVTGTAVLGGLVASCRGITLLVTSREPLHLSGEQQYEVPLLAPDEAVVLFADRARAIRPGRQIDAAIAAAICERVDRLPLAIELAAARTKTFPPTEILARLEQHLPVLAAGPRDAPRRHRTLTAMIDWSYDLLTAPEQELFLRLAVFSGGFTPRAGEIVCDADADTLQDLTDRSLIRVDEAGRYSMLQTIREYALHRLVENGDIDDLRARHARWCVETMPNNCVIDFTADAAVVAHRAAAELENLRAALDWAAARQDPIAGWLIQSLWRWQWFKHGLVHEAQRWIDYAREHEAEYPPELQALALATAGRVAWKRGDLAQATALCEQALALHRQLAAADGVCMDLIMRGILFAVDGDLDQARAVLQAAIEHARAGDVPGAVPWALGNLAGVAIEEGNLDDAWQICEEGLALSESLALTDMLASLFLINLTHVANLQRRHADAARLARRAVLVALEHDETLSAAMALMQMAWAFSELGEPRRAARLLGAGVGFHVSVGLELQLTDDVCEARTLENLRAQLDEPTLQALLDAGCAGPFDDAVHNALEGGASS